MSTYQTACKHGQVVVQANADEFGPAPIRVGVDREHPSVYLVANDVEVGVLDTGQARQLARELMSAANALAAAQAVQ
jgi:hypothetical protein